LCIDVVVDVVVVDVVVDVVVVDKLISSYPKTAKGLEDVIMLSVEYGKRFFRFRCLLVISCETWQFLWKSIVHLCGA
jgi:hypothetical protein